MEKQHKNTQLPVPRKMFQLQYKMSKRTYTRILSPGRVSVITDVFDATKHFGTWNSYLPHTPRCEDKYLYWVRSVRKVCFLLLCLNSLESFPS